MGMTSLIITDPAITNPTWFLGSFEFREPMTTATDFLVALVCWYVVYRLVKTPKNQRNSRYFKLILGYFTCFAIGMTSAAWLGHGLQAYLDPKFKIIGWGMGATGIMLLQLTSFLIIQPGVKMRWHQLFHWLFIVEWLLAVGLMISPWSSFMVTQINSTFGLILLVLPMHFYNLVKMRDQRSKRIILALAYSAIPGFIYSNAISLHPWLNYHDISHLLMAGFMILMYRGLRQFSMIPKTFD